MAQPALSFSTHLSWILSASTIRARVLSVHARACNLITGDERLVALAHPSLGNGPFHILVDLPIPFFEYLSPGQPAHIATGIVHVGNLHVDLRAAHEWAPQIDWPDPPDTTTKRGLVSLLEDTLSHQGQEMDPAAAAARATILPTLSGITEAIARGENARVFRGLSKIIGLGPGLTPAGDDAVLGVLAGLWIWGSTGLSVAEVAQLVDEIARERTHLLSREWLHHAGQGAFAEPWHRLVQAIARAEEDRIRQALRKILHTGASSGEYALRGLLAVTQ